MALADDFDLQEIGQPLRGEGWQCVEEGTSCTRQGRLELLPGTWMARLDERERVLSIGFMALWVGTDFPIPAASATVAADPWVAARAVWERYPQGVGNWRVVSRVAGEPAVVVLEREGERRTVAAWSTTVRADDGGSFRSGVLCVEKSE